MINITRATRVKRTRDRRRQRLLLTVGSKSYHITREEAKRLLSLLNRFKFD